MAPSKLRAIRIVKVHPTKLREFAAKKKSPRKTKGGHHAPGAAPIAPGFKPRPDLNLQQFRGKTVQALSFTNVYLGSSAWADSDIANIDQSLSAAMSDPTLNNVIAQYFSGPITSTFLGSRRSTAPVDATYTRDSVSQTLNQLVSSGQLAGVDFPNAVINLLLPPGTILDTTASAGVGDLDDKDSSLNGLGGYHGSHVAPDGTVIYFAAAVYSEQKGNETNGIPIWPDSWKNVVATLYHELNEARTDADVEDAMRKNNNDLLGWYSTSANGEIGDIPIAEAGNDLHAVFVEVTLASGLTAPVQLMWSNAAGGPGEPFASVGAHQPMH